MPVCCWMAWATSPPGHTLGGPVRSSSRRKCSRPPASPATIVCPLAKAQHHGLASQWNAASGRQVSRSHTFSVLSADAETARFPSAVTATPKTEAEWPSSVRNAPPVSRFHTFSVLSPDAETAHLPSGVTATPVTYHEWPSSVRSARPVSRSHNFSVLSFDAEIARLPSAVTATPLTDAEWPSSVRNARPVSRSHTFSVLSSDAETRSEERR